MSKLEDSSVAFRKTLIAKNDYTGNKPYVAGHPDALSTGDENGKGEVNGSVGGLTDIKTREALIAKNKYNSNRTYNASTA
jgi:hypothetical protein